MVNIFLRKKIRKIHAIRCSSRLWTAIRKKQTTGVRQTSAQTTALLDRSTLATWLVNWCQDTAVTGALCDDKKNKFFFLKLLRNFSIINVFNGCADNDIMQTYSGVTCIRGAAEFFKNDLRSLRPSSSS